MMLFGISAAVLAVGCKTEEVSEQYIRLSDSALSFKGSGSTPVTVTVYSSPAWTIAGEGASWVTISDQTESSFTVSVADNENDSERSTVITLQAGEATAELTIQQMSADNVFARYRFKDEYQYGTAMSPNGLYAGGFFSTTAGSSWEYTVEVTDLTTGEVTTMGPYDRSLSLMQPACITDNGDLFIYNERNSTTLFHLDGTYEEIPQVSGFNGNSNVSQVSGDGSIWVGYASKTGDSRPLIWRDGVAEELPLPPYNYREEPVGIVQARGCSADGKVIFGTTWDNYDYGMIYWDFTADGHFNDGECHFVGEDVREVRPVERLDANGEPYIYNLCDGMWMTAVNVCVSPNGEWIAGGFRRESLSNNEVTEITCPAFYNTKTGKTLLFEDMAGEMGITASSDGLGFTTNASMAMSGDVIDLNTQTVLGSASQWIKDTYGISVSGYIYYKPDNDTVLGAQLLSTGFGMEGVNWFLTLPL